MMKNVLCLTIASLFCFAGSTAGRDLTREEIVSALAPVSMVRLLCNGKEYDGKRISVRGYLSCGHEDSRLYMTKEMGNHLMHENSVMVNYDKSTLRIDPPSLKSIMSAHHKYALLHGTFSSSKNTLNNVSRIVCFDD